MGSKVSYSHFQIDYLKNLLCKEYDEFTTEDTHINVFNHGFNAIYWVRTSRKSWMLRVRPNYPYYDLSSTNVEFATSFQSHLHSVNFPVPHILRRTSGKLYGKLEAPEGDRFYSVHEMLGGRSVYPLSPNQGEAAGKLLATMHELSREYHPNHLRLYFTKEQMLDQPHQLLDLHPEFIPERYEWFDHLLVSMKEEMSKLDLSNYPFVILHGDFWHGNLLVDQSTIHIVDFDFSCYGPRELDLASFLILGYQRALDEGSDLKKVDEMFSQLVRGYTSMAPEGIDKKLLIELSKMRVTWIIGGYLAVIGIQSYYGIRKRVDILLQILNHLDGDLGTLIKRI